MASSSVETITLVSSDDKEFKITVGAAMQSEQLKCMVNDDCASDEIPIDNVNSQTLVKVIEYCEKHFDHEATKSSDGVSDAEAKKIINGWDEEFIKVDAVDTLLQILTAADYLEIKGLFDLTCQTVADLVKGKKVTQIRQIFHLKNDFTPQEQERLRKQHPNVDVDF